MESTNIIQRDLSCIWHPCSQMKDYETFSPLVITKAKGSYLYLNDGRKIIDAISSWWCKSLGHNHPRLRAALFKQAKKFEHVIFVNTTNEVIIELSEKLTGLTKNLQKIFYASDGSSAIEIALKMSLHARQILGEKHKTQFIALTNGYHGETMGALSISDVDIYKQAYQSMLFKSYMLQPIPYVKNTFDPLWINCADEWDSIEKQLQTHAEKTTAVIVEPIVQAACGMRIYSQDFLQRLRAWTEKNNIHLIADEIMTGLGRTGKMLACEHADIEADFLCLGKGLTAGWLPLSAVLTKNSIYELFYDDYAQGKSFLHSHTYSGNALAASIALEVLQIMQEEDVCQTAMNLGQIMVKAMQDIAASTNKITNVRHIGAIVAADLICENDKRKGYEVYQKAVQLGALLRPLGNTIYWLPPINTSVNTIECLKNITLRALQSVLF